MKGLAMGNKITALDDFEDEINSILEDYIDEVFEKSDAAIEGFVQKIVAELKRTSNRSDRKGDEYKKYAEGWMYAKERYMDGYIYTIYNEAKPTLTHLLEFGWLNEYTEVLGNAHISKAFEKYQEQIIDELWSQMNK